MSQSTENVIPLTLENANVASGSSNESSADGNPYMIILSKRYKYEGEEYTSIDLSGLENLSTEDLTLAEKMFTASQNVSIVAELNLGYCVCVASVATGKAVKFFNKLPARDGMQVKNAVAHFFLNGE